MFLLFIVFFSWAQFVTSDPAINPIIDPRETYFTTIAGNGLFLWSCRGEECYPSNHAATDNSIGTPQDIFVDIHGNIFIADISMFRIVKVDSNGTMVTVAGNGDMKCGCCDNQLATSVGIFPFGITGDSNGNIYFSEPNTHRIRMISNITGTLETIAGKNPGIGGFSLDGVVARGNYLSTPYGLQIDSNGYMYFADRGSCRIRSFHVNGGTLSTVLGDGSCRRHDGLDAMISAASLEYPYSIALDSNNRVYFTEENQNYIRRIGLSGMVRVIAGNGSYNNPVDGVSVLHSSIASPRFLYVDSSYNVYVTTSNNMIRYFNPYSDNTFQTLTTFSNSIAYGCSLSTMNFAYLTGLTGDSAGNVYVADYQYRRVYRISDSQSFTCSPSLAPTTYPSGPTESPTIRPSISSAPSMKPTVIGSPFSPPERWISTFAGKYCWNGRNSTCIGPNIASNRPIYGPYDIFVDTANDDTVYIVTADIRRIVKVNQNGSYSIVAGNGSYYGSILNDVPATLTSLGYIQGITGDMNGSIFFSEHDRNLIRKVDQLGIISTVGGILPGRIPGFTPDGQSTLVKGVFNPGGLQYDSLRGRLMYFERGFCTIRAIDLANGVVETLVGTGGCQSYSFINRAQVFDEQSSVATNFPLTYAQYFHARINATTNDYDLYIPDGSNQYIYRVSLATKAVYIFAGNGNFGYDSYFSLATSTSLASPMSVTSDSVGNVYIGMYEGQVKVVNPDGIMYSYVQDQQPRWEVIDCVPATSAGLYSVYGMAVDSKGNLYIADYDGYQVRRVTQEQLCGPTSSPTFVPTATPSTEQPSAIPSNTPSVVPSFQPSEVPSFIPTFQPSPQPTYILTAEPSVSPSHLPTQAPSEFPSFFPTEHPSFNPTYNPTCEPTYEPTRIPTYEPTYIPTYEPTYIPTYEPTHIPTYEPTHIPTYEPTLIPICNPTFSPTCEPTLGPTCHPTVYPTESLSPTRSPSMIISEPTIFPSVDLLEHTLQPSFISTDIPFVTIEPSVPPTQYPSLLSSTIYQSSVSPTISPTFPPTFSPSESPTLFPTELPLFLSSVPSQFPTINTIATNTPSQAPTIIPTETPAVTSSPSFLPSVAPTSVPPSQVLYVVYATLSSDGVFGEVFFNSETNRALKSGLFPCSDCLRFNNASFLSCSWYNNSVIRIRRSSTVSGFEIGQSLFLKTPTQLAPLNIDGNTNYAIDFSEIIIRRPNNGLVPKVVIESASVLQVCSDWILDLTRTSGNANRPWLSHNITIESFHPLFNLTWGKSLEKYISKYFSTTIPLRIPSKVLITTIGNATVPFSLRIQVCNYFGACSESVFDASISQEYVSSPKVSFIVLNYPLSLYVNQTLRIATSAFMPLCGSSIRTQGLSFSWSILSNEEVLNISSISLDLSKFILPPFSLLPGKVYNVSVSVRDTQTSISTTKVLQVITLSSDLVVGVFPALPSVLGISQAIAVDASLASFDPDNKNAHLHCSWQIFSADSDLTNVISLSIRNSSTGGIGCIAALATSSVITSTSIATLQLRIISKGEYAVKEKTVSFSITLRAIELPYIAIQSSPLSLQKLDAAQAINIAATITSPFSTISVWSLTSTTNSNVSFSTLSTAPIVPNTVNPAYLYISPGTLSIGESYLFRLDVAGSSAVIYLTTNSPPYDGGLSVAPSTGFALETMFLAAAMGWIDEDIPLQYSFRFSADNMSTWLPIQSLSPLSYASSVLPSGKAELSNLVYIVVNIADSVGLMSNQTEYVYVSPPSSLSASNDVLTGLLQNATLPQDVLQLVSVGSVVVTSTNCSGAGADGLSCFDLHRADCRLTSHTCGNCLSGYAGMGGDSNTPCYLVSNLQQASRKLANASRIDGVSTCSSNTDCYPWEYCDKEGSSSCKLKMQECSKDCSGHGQCSFRSLQNFQNVTSCSIIDTTCMAMCFCELGYGGEDCSLTSNDLQVIVDMKKILLSSVDDILPKLGTSNAPDLEDLVSILTVLTTNPDSLQIKSIAVVLTALDHLINIASTTISPIPASTVTSIAKCADALNVITIFLLKQAPSVSAEYLIRTGSLVEQIASILSQASLPDSSSSGIVQPFFRSTVQSLTIGNRKNISEDLSIVTHQTAMEELLLSTSDNENQLSSFHIQEIIRDDATPLASVSIRMSELSPLLFNKSERVSTDSIISNVVSLKTSFEQVQVISAIDSHDSVAVIPPSVGLFEILIPHTNEISSDTANDADLVWSVNCSVSNMYATLEYACPGSNDVLTVFCNGTDSLGTWTKYCPVKQAQCSSLSKDDVPLECTVLEASEQFTRCGCRSSVAQQQMRRLSGSDTTNIVSTAYHVAVLVTYVSNNFADSFSAATAFDSTAAWEKSVIVMMLYGSFWFFCCLLMIVLYFRGESIKANKLFAQQQKQLQQHTKSRSNNNSSKTQTRQMLQVRLLAYIESVIPSVFEDKPFLIRLAEEMTNNHLYLNLVTKGFSSSRAYVDIFRAMTVFTVLMFLLAMMYDLQYPNDDGSCATHLTASDCLRRKSVLDSSLSYCLWEEGQGISGVDKCVFNATDNISFADAAICAMVTSWFSSVFTRPLDFLFGLLLAPTIEDLNAQRAAKETFQKLQGNTVYPILPVAHAKLVKSPSNNAIDGRTTLHIPPETQEAQKEIRLLMSQELKQHTTRAVTKLLSSHSSRSKSMVCKGSIPELNIAKADFTIDGDGKQDDLPIAIHTQEILSLSASQVIQELQEQRRSLVLRQQQVQQQGKDAEQMQENMLELFDRSWGLLLQYYQSGASIPTSLLSTTTPTGWRSFCNGLLPSCMQQKLDNTPTTVEEMIVDWKIHTYRHSQECFNSKTFQTLTDNERGVFILQLFLLDVIGRDTPAAKIFASKSENSIYPTTAVSRWVQRLVLVGMILVNLFCMFYSVLKGYQKGVQWQRAYALSCVIQLVTEIAFFETLEAIWVDFLVPNLVYKEINRCQVVLKKLVQEISRLLLSQQQMSHDKDGTAVIMNVPSHFYVSYNLAKRFPLLIESMMVLSYESYLPIGLPFDGTNNSTDEAAVKGSGWFSCGSVLITSFVSTFVALIAMIPTEGHRIVLRFFAPFLCGGLTLLWRYIISNTIWLMLFVVIVGTVSLYIVWTILKFHFEDAKKQRLLALVTPEDHVDDKYEAMRTTKTQDEKESDNLNEEIPDKRIERSYKIEEDSAAEIRSDVAPAVSTNEDAGTKVMEEKRSVSNKASSKSPSVTWRKQMPMHGHHHPHAANMLRANRSRTSSQNSNTDIEIGGHNQHTNNHVKSMSSPTITRKKLMALNVKHAHSPPHTNMSELSSSVSNLPTKASSSTTHGNKKGNHTNKKNHNNNNNNPAGRKVTAGSSSGSSQFSLSDSEDDDDEEDCDDGNSSKFELNSMESFSFV